MLNEVKHLSGAGIQKIFHFVQDDNWTRIERAREAKATSRGCSRLSIPVMLNEVKHLSGAGGQQILHFVQDDKLPPLYLHALAFFLATRYNLDRLARFKGIHMHAWQLQEAKNKLSELIDRALAEGPQVITRHGVEVVVVMPFSGFQKLTTPTQRLGDFFTSSPLRAGDLQIERDPDIVLREIDL